MLKYLWAKGIKLFLTPSTGQKGERPFQHQCNPNDNILIFACWGLS